jgi:NADH dehydrogenase
MRVSLQRVMRYHVPMTRQDAGQPSAPQKRIVVLGAGFGGVYALRRLHRSLHGKGVFTIVNRQNYFLFTPLLHEVATGSLAPHVIVEPLRTIFGCCRLDIRLGEVRKIRLADKVVETSAGDAPYDALVVALGAETNFYGVPGAAEHAFTLKSIDDAAAMKRKMIDAFDAAAMEKDEAVRRVLLRFVVVGGGPTGVELVAEIAEFVFGTLGREYRGALGGVKPEITLLQQGPELIPQFTAATRGKALDALRRKGIEIRLLTAVTAVDADGVTLADGEHIASRFVAWVAGVKPANAPFDVAVGRDAAGRVIVDANLELPGHPGVFVVGDVASFTQDGHPLPPFAQVAVSMAEHAAANLARRVGGEPLQPFRYRNRGNLISIGQWMAAAEIGPFRFWGHFAWWLWRTIYLTKFISFRKKFVIALQWTINLASPRDDAKI